MLTAVLLVASGPALSETTVHLDGIVQSLNSHAFKAKAAAYESAQVAASDKKWHMSWAPMPAHVAQYVVKHGYQPYPVQFVTEEMAGSIGGHVPSADIVPYGFENKAMTYIRMHGMGPFLMKEQNVAYRYGMGDLIYGNWN
jgi:hypothetical protein